MTLASGLRALRRTVFCLPLLVLGASAQTRYTFTTFTVPNAAVTAPFAINERGDVTGFYQETLTSAQIGFLRLSSGETTTLLYPGAIGSMATGINNLGVTAGTYWYQAGGTLAGFFYRLGAYQNVFVNGYPASVSDINDLGYYIGSYGTSQTFMSFLASPTDEITILQYPSGYRTGASWIKNNGEVIGTYLDGTGRIHTFIYSSASGYKTISIPGRPRAAITDINSSGVVVGGYFNGVTNQAFTYHGGQFRILAVPGATNSTATAINNKGQIVGGYTTLDGANVGYIATPVP